MFKAVFFDLDGTLIDTACDFERAINSLLKDHGRPALAFARIRAEVSNGARALTRLAFGIAEQDAGFDTHLNALLDAYEHQVNQRSQLFAGMDQVLTSLEQNAIAWGIVTNKPERFTTPLLVTLGLTDRACSVICPDHVQQRKPHPEGLLIAASQAGVDARDCLYVGDHERDIAAGRNASMATAAARYGYITAGDNPDNWQADYQLDQPLDLLPLINRSQR